MEPKMFVTPEEVLNPSHTALLVIDMQKDFLVEGFAAHKEAGRDVTVGRSIIPNVQKLVAAARKSNVLVGHVGFLTLRNHASDSGPWLAGRRRATYSSENLCIEGTEGAEFIPELIPQEGELIILKHRFSGFRGTNLDLLLRSHRIETVITCGVSTNICVGTTLQDAFQLDYYVAIPKDATASWNMQLHEATMQNVMHRFGLVTTCKEIIECWERASTK